MPLSALLAAVLSVLGVIWFVVVGVRGERRSRRHAAELARRGKRALPPDRGGRGMALIVLGVAVGMATCLLSARPGSRPLAALPGVPEGPWTIIVVTAMIVVVLAVCGAWWEERRKPQARAARLARAGNIAGAIAEIEARVATRRRPPAPAPWTAPGPAGPDPFAPPGAAIDPAGRRAQADDLNMLGVLEGMQGNWPVALPRFEEADALMDGSMPAYRSNRGIALVRLGRVEAGLGLVDEALADLAPDDHPGRFQLLGQAAVALAELGRGAEARARLDAAEAACRRITVLFPGARKARLGQVAALRARLDEAEAKAAEPDTVG